MTSPQHGEKAKLFAGLLASLVVSHMCLLEAVDWLEVESSLLLIPPDAVDWPRGINEGIKPC